MLPDGGPDEECPEDLRLIGCRNGGTCWNRTCCCIHGFIGVECETEIMECASDPCGEGATCEEMVDGYECLCLPGKGILPVLFKAL